MKFKLTLLALMMSSHVMANDATDNVFVDDSAPILTSEDSTEQTTAADSMEAMQMKMKILEMELELERLKSRSASPTDSMQSPTATDESAIKPEDQGAVPAGSVTTSIAQDYTNPDFWPTEAEYKTDTILKQPVLLKREIDSRKVFGALLVTVDDYYTMAPDVRIGVQKHLGVVMQDGKVEYPQGGAVGERRAVDYKSIETMLKAAMNSKSQDQINFIVNSYTLDQPLKMKEVFGNGDVRSDVLGCFAEVTSDDERLVIGSVSSFDGDSQEALVLTPAVETGSGSLCSGLLDGRNPDHPLYTKINIQEEADLALALSVAGVSTVSCSHADRGRVVTWSDLASKMGGEWVKAESGLLSMSSRSAPGICGHEMNPE